jgi:hypothetical protein
MSNPKLPIFSISSATIATDADLLVAKNNAQAQLTAAINATDMSLSVSASGVFGTPTIIAIGNELIKVASDSGTTLTVATGGRGWRGTLAQPHAIGDWVLQEVDEDYHNQLAAEIIAIEQALVPNTTPFTAATLQNNWATYSLTGASPAAYYRDILGWVHLRGQIAGGSTAIASVILNLPSGFRPPNTIGFQYFQCLSWNGSIYVPGAVRIDNNGNVLYLAGSNSFLSLDGIQFNTMG